MISKNNEWVIVFNGCLYNFKELKKELKAKGYYFVSKTDTEVICGLSAYGVAFLKD